MQPQTYIPHTIPYKNGGQESNGKQNILFIQTCLNSVLQDYFISQMAPTISFQANLLLVLVFNKHPYCSSVSNKKSMQNVTTTPPLPDALRLLKFKYIGRGVSYSQTEGVKVLDRVGGCVWGMKKNIYFSAYTLPPHYSCQIFTFLGKSHYL